MGANDTHTPEADALIENHDGINIHPNRLPKLFFNKELKA